jgi:hypothetical protein
MFDALVRDKNNRKRGKLEHHEKSATAKLISRKANPIALLSTPCDATTR